MINKQKGTLDVLPNDSWKWHKVETAARETARLYSLKEIRTPTFEATELFLRGVGGTTDIVTKEMYTFTDKGGRSITLKPEGTAGVARAYIEAGLSNEPQPVKMYYFTPVFRYERPQAGRLREHHQFGVELYGAQAASMDAEAILIAKSFFDSLGIKDLTLNINSIGCETCRAGYNKALKDYIKPNLDSMCDTCKVRFDKNPLRILDCKEEGCKTLNKNAPSVIDHLCPDCAAHFSKLQGYLKAYGIEYVINPLIVRGLDYYNRTVFEFVSNSIGAQGTVCAGGRYDRLVSDVGGGATPAVGFGLGLERLINVMTALGLMGEDISAPDVYIVTADAAAETACLILGKELRESGISCECDHMGRSIKAQLKYADKLKCRMSCIIGGDELSNNTVTVKDMGAGGQESVKRDRAAAFIKTRLYGGVKK